MLIPQNQTILLIAVFLFASFAQTLSGFGFALMGMPLATLILGAKTAAPLVALAGLTLYTLNVLRYRRAINFREIRRLGFAALLGVPVGVWGLANLDESWVKFILGWILIGYAVSSLARPTPSFVPSQRWGYLTGFLTGCLGGAFNLPGPPLIVYGALRQWRQDEFRATLQTLFFITGTLTVISHLFAQHLTQNILTLYVFSAPALILGIILGSIIDRRIHPKTFRLITLAMILILGVVTLTM